MWKYIVAMLPISFGVSLYAQEPLNPVAELIRQVEQQEQLLDSLMTDPDVRIEATAIENPAATLRSKEALCFAIDDVRLEAIDGQGAALEVNPFDWSLPFSFAMSTGEIDFESGQCIGVNAIRLMMSRIQNAIIEKGFVTTRILAGPQNLKSGKLVLTVVPGQLKDVVFAENVVNEPSLNAVPLRADGMLFLRDIEQGLENFKRVPTADADIQIVPSQSASAKPGDSDLLISWSQSKPFRLSFSLDDSGSKATDVYQASATLSLDNLFGLNDLFYVSLGNDAGGGNKGPRGTRSVSYHYSLPFGYSTLSLNHSDNSYYQTVNGALEDYVYSGDSTNSSISWTRMLYRNAKRKTQLELTAWARSSHNFIDDTEVPVQRRRTGGWSLGINHKEFIDDKTWEFDLQYKRGTGAFGSLAAPEEKFNEGTSRPEIVNLMVSFKRPLTIFGVLGEYQGQLKGQWTSMPLVGQDRFSIGSRYSVRGFDGESSLSGERGFTLRNTLTTPIRKSAHNLYLAYDLGKVSGPSTAFLPGKMLSGAAIGVKGTKGALTYDAFLGKPFVKPDNFRTDKTVFNFSLNWSF